MDIQLETTKQKMDNVITTNWVNIWDKMGGHPGMWRYGHFIQAERDKFEGLVQIFPPSKDVFRCFNYFNCEDTRVVILGQDPYHGASQANGLAFAVNRDVKKPPSLKNIEKELGKEADIESWAKQGVLMLNASLTVREKTPGSYMKFWEPYTASIIEHLNTFGQDIVFVAWGAFALKQLENVNTEKHTLLVSSHPSPLGANRSLRNYPAFIGSDVFNKINSALTDKGIPAIVW